MFYHFVDELQGSNGRAVAVLEGHAQDGAGGVARLSVHLLVEPVVRIRVGDVQDFAELAHLKGKLTTPRRSNRIVPIDVERVWESVAKKNFNSN